MKARSRKLTSRFDRKSSPRSARQLIWVIITVGFLILYAVRPSDGDLSGLDEPQMKELVDSLAQTREEAARRALQPEEPTQRTTSVDVAASLASIAQVQNTLPLKAQKFAVVHLGKCGGVSMREALTSYVGHKTVLSKVDAAAKWYHISKPEVDVYQNWILLIRDPISRLQSWWTYDHPDNFNYRKDYLGFPYKSEIWPQFFECYPTLDEFLTKGLVPATEVSHTDKCKILGLMAAPLRGSSYITGFQHMRFNFDRYFAQLLESEDIEKFYVVRSESMLDDLNGINKLLGDKENALPAVSHMSHWRTKDYPNKDRTISAEGMENLCRHLCNEIRHYKHILARGENLSLEEAANSMQQLAKSCPIQVNSDECPIGMTEEEWEAMVHQFRLVEQKEVQQVSRDAQKYKAEVAKNVPPMPKSLKLKEFRKTELDDSFGFLHLGRCGGRSVRLLLESHKQSTLYKKLEAGGTWSKTGKPLLWKHRHWVVMVRDPMERAMSWWIYHHPVNLERRSDRKEVEALPEHMRAEWKFLYDCYPSLQELALDGLALPNQAAGAKRYPNQYRQTCRQVAQRAMPTYSSSRVPLMNEIDFSYVEHDHDFHFEGKVRSIFVVRVEQMVADLNGIEQMLTREESDIFEKVDGRQCRDKFRTKYWPENDPELGPKAKASLCLRLCQSIQTYKKLLRAAINLTEKSYQLSMVRLAAYCPEQVDNAFC
jgi:hypothetical protein